MKHKKKRSKKVQVLLFILGFLTFGIGWVALLFYRIFTYPRTHHHDKKES